VTGRRVQRRGIQVAAVAALIALAASAPAQAAGVSRTARAGSGTGSAQVAALDVVVLVDESGSETPAKVADEKQTVGTIVQSMLNPGSRVTVVGFGGVNHVAPNQTPVDVVCQPTIASGTQNLSYLASCVSKLHRRTEQEGDDTDYAAALGQAMSYLSPASTATPPAPSGAIKVILMMTDGAVDVHRDTQQYGANWMEGEQQAVNQQLAAARSDGVQVWPLGFGTDIGTGITESQALDYLNQVAVGGAAAVCDKRHVANQPHATWVNDPSDAINALNQLYADAACLGTGSSQITIGGGVQSGTLTVSIPDIASDAVISVDRVNPAIQVGFSLPDGRSWTDSSAISGQDTSPVEVLHVSNITSDEVGTWKIHLTAPPGLASQLVSATVFWQGAVRAVITANPPSAKLGQPISVTLSVLGPNGPITDPATLKNLLVGVTVSGDGLPGPTQVPVTSAATPARSGTGVGDYTGTFAAPNQQGTLTFTGTAAGYGLYATQVPATVGVGTASAGFTASIQYPVVSSVQAGSSITGHVVFTNQTGATKHVRLVLTTSGANAAITSPSGTISAPSGNSPSVPFTVSFDKNSPIGSAWLQVKVADAANPGLVYNEATLNIAVTRPPGFIAKYLWDIIGIIAALILVVLFVLWRRELHRRRVDVRGLIAILRRDGEQLGAELRAPSKWSDSFRFIVRDEGEPTVRLDYPQPGFSLYTVRRSGNGEVTLVTPAGERYEHVVVGGPGEHMERGGLELAFRDKSRPRAAGRPARAARPQDSQGGRGAPVPGQQPSAPQPYDQNGTRTIPSPSAPKDEWL
jgi:von Willebrand factor type A domain